MSTTKSPREDNSLKFESSLWQLIGCLSLYTRSQSVSQLEARSFPHCRVIPKGAETDIGTDLCDTHAASRITHSIAHNILPLESRIPDSLPSAPLSSRPPIAALYIYRARDATEWKTDVPILPILYTQYLLRIGIMFLQWFPSCVCFARWNRRCSCRFIAIKWLQI